MKELASSEILLIITAMGGFVTLIGAQIVNIIVARRASYQSAQNAVKVAEVSAKADVIVGHVNSEKTAAEGREAALRKENDLLREMLSDKKQVAALLAQATANAISHPIPVQVVNTPSEPVPTITETTP